MRKLSSRCDDKRERQTQVLQELRLRETILLLLQEKLFYDLYATNKKASHVFYENCTTFYGIHVDQFNLLITRTAHLACFISTLWSD